MLSFAQIVAGGAHAPNVIQTPNGLDQININRPSGAGVSVNSYSQFDVQSKGAILNNSPTMVQSQLGGMINGNPNFNLGQAAKVIVNQVSSASASQFNGALEVAGQRANVILANPSGISVNGGTFINTSRATLTTGTPNYATDGSVSGFNVTGGNIAITGAGLNASGVDQVDLLARAVQANAAVYARNLKVVTGANSVEYNTLNATLIAGDGAGPGVSIDVSSLGSMYANRIVLVGTEAGVGVSLKGVTAAQSGDLVLTSAGKLVLAGQANASGNIVANATGGIDNSGTTYAQQSVSLSASGALTNSGLVAAQQNTTASAASVSSTGTFAAGVNNDGSLAQSGDLSVSASGAVTATGRNVAGGNAGISGASVNLAGATNSANGALALTASAGDLNLSSTTTTAGGTLDARASGTLTNDNGAMSSGGAQTIAAGALSNRGGQIVSGSTLTENVTGATNNQGGTMQAAGALASSSGSLDNSGGTVASLNADGVSISSSGMLNNGAGGSIGGNGAVSVRAGQIANAGSITAVQSLIASAVQTLFNSGTFATDADMTLSAGTTLSNAGQFGAARSLVLSAATFDNSGGAVSANQFTLHAANLVNHGGTITQTGTGATTLDVTGTLDNSAGGTLQTNSTDLTIAPATLDNDGGTITHAGTGNLSINAGNGSGTVSNVGGKIAGNGQIALQGGALNNTGGSIAAQSGLNAAIGGTLDNTNGKLLSNTDTSLTSGTLNNTSGQIGAGTKEAISTGSLFNNGGTIVAPNLTLTGTTLDNSGGDIEANQLSLTAANLTNRGGSITQYGATAMGFNVSGAFDNSDGGTFQTSSTDLTLAPGSLDNDGGTITHAGTGNVTVDAGNGSGSISNAAGTIVSNGKVALQGGSLNNTAGSVSGQKGLTANVSGALDNGNGKLLSNTDTGISSGSLNNDGGQIGAATSETISTGSLTNNGGSIVAPDLTLTTGATLDNSGGDIEANQLALTATDLLNRGGSITQYGTSSMGFSVSGTFDNSNGGTLQTNSTDFTLAPGALNNDDGSIIDAGTGTLTIAPGYGSGTISNVGGKIIAAGQIAARAASLNNANGVLAAQGRIAANIAGDLNNTQGSVRSLSSLSLASGGTLSNTNGQIQSGTGTTGDTGTLAVQAASVDNTNGLVGNLGTGDTTVQGGSQTVNSGGVITGNGAVKVDTSALSNTQNGQISGASVTVHGDTVDNSGGQIGSFAGSNGDVAITTTGTVTNANGQIGAAHDLDVNAATLTGGGSYSAANDVAVSVQGDFAPTPDVQFNAGHDLSFTLPGTFSNNALVEAANNLNINAADVQNNGVMMAGGTLSTQSTTLENTGTMVGGSVSLNATQSLTNTGPTALIGATDSNGTLELLSNDIENRDDTTATDTQATTAIYGLGKVVLAGGKDASGNYTNANLIRNQSGLIESAGDMELHAGQVTNTRTTMTTTGLNQSVDPDLLAQLGISLSGCTALDMNACSEGHPYVGWTTQGDPNAIGGAYTIPPHGGQWNSGYQYTIYTGVALANLIAGISPQAQIVSGGNLDALNVGTFQNYWSAVAAVGNIAAPQTLDQNSWQGQAAPGVQVTYSGYYHYTNYDHSIADWTLPFGNAPFIGNNPGGYTQAAPADIRNYALPSYESSFVAGGTLSGNGISIDNTAGNAGVPSLNLAPGQAMSGVNINGVSGNASGADAGSASAAQGSASGGKSGAASVKGGGGMVDPTIASATAQNVLQNLSIPPGGLFSPATAPGATYLIESNPAFTNAKTFISSDYYLQQLGLNPQTTEKRLGDGFYEQQLVRNQITSLTGKVVLGPYTDLQGMYESLLAAGASLSKSLDLPLGMSLSPEQVAALTSNVIIMQTKTVNGQQVLVPVVYLAKASQQNMNGPLIAATDIDIQNAQTFTNGGTVQAANTMSIQGAQINNAFGSLQSGGLMSLTTAGNVDLTSATVNAGSLALNAGGDLLLNTTVKTVDQVSATGATRTTTTLGPIANLNVAGNAVIVTGGNVEQNAGNLNVGGSLGMSVGGNYDIGSVQTGEHKIVERANGVSNTDLNQTTGSSIKVGGVSAIGVGGDLTATGANINLAGGGTLAANGNVNLQAAKSTSTVDSNSSGSDGHGSYSESSHRSDDTLTATTLNAGNSLTVASGKDINVTGSAISLDKGTATLAAAGNVNIGAATETHVDNEQEQHKHSNVVSGKEVASSSNSTATLAQGSMVSADGVAISSGKDINVAGSTIVGTNDVALNAAHGVNITTTQDTMQSSSSYQEKSTGLGTAGLSVTVGTNKLATTNEASSVTNNASTVGSLNGDLSINAGNTLHVTGSDLVAGKNLAGTAANVIIDAVTDTSHQAQTQKTSSSGLTIGLAGSVGDAINNAYSESQAAKNSTRTGNDRAAALHSIAAAGDIGLAAFTKAGMTKDGTPDIGVKVSIGSSKSESQSSEDQTMQRGSSVQAGGTAGFVATNGDVTIAGSNVSANDVILAAKNQVNVINTTDTDSTRSSNSSSSASIGVQYTTGGGFGVSAAMSNAHGDANSDASIQNASHVNGANSVTVISGGDTNIIGSQINGKQIAADVGGNLNITSVQDTTQSNAHQQSSGGGFSISQGGGGASFSTQHGDGHGNYANVTEQAGINAGDGGFDINVKGNTGLMGAVISSTADAEKSSLTTGTLSFSDIQNHSDFSASSSGFSAGGAMGAPDKAVGPASVSGSGGVTPMMGQHDSGNENGTTRSAVSAGTITINDTAHETQDVANLSRDTTNTNGTVTKTPDVNDLLDRQSEMMGAASAAGQTVAQGIGEYADMKQKETGDAAWAEGGLDRTALHIAGGALVAGLGGGSIGSAAQSAAGGGIASAFAGKLNSLADGIGGETGSMLAGNIMANVLAGAGGALVGGSTGAFTAANVDLYNRSTGNGDGKGGTGSQVLDWIGGQLASAGRGAENLANQFAALVNANGPQGPYLSPDDLNGPGGSSKPPATGGSAVPVAVCVPPVCTVVPAATSGTAGYAPGNATLNSGNNDSEAGGSASGDVNLASPDRTTHILTGDATGGGHQWPGGPGKSVFPENWPASKIMDAVSDIATDPTIAETVQANGRIVKNGTRDGIDIRVVIEPASKGGGIVTAFPTNVPRNPK